MSSQPQAICQGLIFWPIPDTSDLQCAFGLDGCDYFDRRSLPKIPRDLENKVESIFFSGGKLDGLDPTVDPKKASRRMHALLCSFAPSHEAKIATAAYALWVWQSVELTKA